MSRKRGGYQRSATWYEDRRRRIWGWGIGVLVTLVILLVSALRSEYLSLQASGDQHAADRLISTIIVIFLIVFAVVLLVGWWWVGRFARRTAARLDVEFEDSIADLAPEDQSVARRKRAAVHAAMAVGAYAIVHGALKEWSQRSQEDVVRTRERNDRINEALDANRNRFTSWDDPV